MLILKLHDNEEVQLLHEDGTLLGKLRILKRKKEKRTTIGIELPKTIAIKRPAREVPVTETEPAPTC